MSWTEDQLNQVRDKMSLAKRQGVWITASEVDIVLGLIRFWQRATRQANPAEGLMPTIGDSRRQHQTHVFVDCGALGCGNTRRLSFDDLGLPDETVFVEIARRKRFVCHRCRSRNVSVRVDWPLPRMGSGSRDDGAP